jgi:hypothetical protein
MHGISTRWFKYDRDYLCVNKSQFVPVIFESPCTSKNKAIPVQAYIGLEGSRSFRLPGFSDSQPIKMVKLSRYRPGQALGVPRR